MTDEEILKAAESIKRRRLAQAKLASFDEADDVIIRWSVKHQPGKSREFPESYVSITVPRDAVEAIVKEHYNKLITAKRSPS